MMWHSVEVVYKQSRFCDTNGGCSENDRLRALARVHAYIQTTNLTRNENCTNNFVN